MSKDQVKKAIYEEREENQKGIPPQFRRTEKEIFFMSYLNSRKRIEEDYKSIEAEKIKLVRYETKYPELKGFVKSLKKKKQEKKKEPETEEEKEKEKLRLEKKREKNRLMRQKRVQKKKEAKKEENKMDEDAS